MGRSVEGCQELVARFHDKILPPGVTAKDQFLKLVEEVGELAVGLHKDNLQLTTDALADCLYVLCGIANMKGVDLGEAFDAIHASNMTKTRDGSLSPKGVGYVPPNLGHDQANCRNSHCWCKQ